MPEPTDDRPPLPIADHTALHDQAAAEVRNKALVVAAYWRGLRENGVPEYEALELAQDFQHDFMAPILERRRRPPEDPDA